MKRIICKVWTVLAAALILTSCKSTSTTGKESDQKLNEAIYESYYAGQSDPAFEYFQHSRIQKFLAMWVKEGTGDIDEPQWDLESFTEISVLNYDLTEYDSAGPLYSCTFSDGAGRFGYVILEYDAFGPSVSNFGVKETTPYRYDLRAHEDEIRESLAKTDIDLLTARAFCVCLYDEDREGADQAIRFTDDKGDNYICFYGDETFEIEKWPLK